MKKQRIGGTKIIDGEIKAQCALCEKTEQALSDALKEWEMQHFHFSDVTLDVLTCDQCKLLGPMKIHQRLEEIGKEKMN